MPCSDDAHDFVGAFKDLMDPQVAHDLFNPVISQIAIAAVQLQALVGCSAANFGAKFFRHGAKGGCIMCASV